MRILITAGPTHEYLDAVRYLANPSSGKMGFALARAARKRGHRVTLISGPVHLAPPPGVRLINIVSARQMQKAVRRYFPKSDCLIMSAAVGDYRPQQIFKHKIKKNNKILMLKLVRNPDILKEAAFAKAGRITIGFALETENLQTNALKKMKNKNLDYIILNTPASFGNDKINAAVFNRSGRLKQFKNVSKNKLSEYVIQLAEKNTQPPVPPFSKGDYPND